MRSSVRSGLSIMRRASYEANGPTRLRAVGEDLQLGLLIAGVFAIAVLYSSVGHAGASGYIALMTLLGLAPGEIRPTALALNILVASIATWHFVRAGHFRWSLFWPFVVLAVPAAYLGGAIVLPAKVFNLLLGMVLLYSAVHFMRSASSAGDETTSAPPLWAAVLAGAAIGLLAGLTGTGGAIFLTPLLLLMGWARAKQAAAVSAPFVLVNSASGLLGFLSGPAPWPPGIPWLLLAAGLGGTLGSRLGSRHLAAPAIKRFLAAVLVVAGAKLLLT
jgi:uncharacterized membrane protein YfcA